MVQSDNATESYREARAATKAGWSTTSPRATLIRVPVGFIWASSAAPSREPPSTVSFLLTLFYFIRSIPVGTQEMLAPNDSTAPSSSRTAGEQRVHVELVLDAQRQVLRQPQPPEQLCQPLELRELR